VTFDVFFVDRFAHLVVVFFWRTATGAPGRAGGVGATGVLGDIGFTGQVGSTGFRGVQGTVGHTGPPGPPGAAGLDASADEVLGRSAGKKKQIKIIKNFNFYVCVDHSYVQTTKLFCF